MPYDPGLFLPSPNVDLLLFLSINYVDVIVKLYFSNCCLKKLSIMLRITLMSSLLSVAVVFDRIYLGSRYLASYILPGSSNQSIILPIYPLYALHLLLSSHSLSPSRSLLYDLRAYQPLLQIRAV